MQLSHESYRTRWLVLVVAWSIAGTALFWHAGAVRDYLSLVNGLGLRGAAGSTTPLKQSFPAFAADAQTWVRHALSLAEGDSLQLRYTTIDNAPTGREVHWNSAWAWCIVGAGKVYQLFTGLPLPTAVERATIWLTPFALLVLIIILSSFATRRVGLIAGLLLVVAMSCHDRLLEGFFPSYVDHHGLLTISVLALVLGGVLMGGGWWQDDREGSNSILPGSPEVVRSGAVFSAIAGACGIWVSAASTIPPIAIMGVAGVLAIIIQGRSARAQGATFDPDAWRLWGRVGGAACLFFYLVEYFPRHFGMRLEVNHPLHAIAWWGGGELIAEFGTWWLAPAESRSLAWRRILWPALAVVSVPATIVIGGPRVLAFMDPFMSHLHNDWIQEFLPLWKTLRTFDAKMIFQIVVVDSAPLIAAIATLTYRRRESPIVLWFATIIAVLLTGMAWLQSRWMLNASGGQVCLALVVLACWTISHRLVVRWIAAIALMGVLYIPSGVVRLRGVATDMKALKVSPKDANNALARDIATTLRATQPQGEITMLASPNASTTVGYYGRFKTLGTLYWENSEGLKAAAAIFSARTEAEAAALIRQHKITHIAILSEENFIEQYCRLLRPGITDDEIRASFGFRLFFAKVVPQWLQMIPYKVPDDLKGLNMTVMLFKVNFEQTLVEAIYNVALTQISQDAYDEAERTLDLLIKQAPQLYQPWLRKAELQLARHNWADAAANFLKGISLAPEADRPNLYANTAGSFYNNQQHAYAVRIYRAGLAEKRTPELVCYLAWVLATSKDDSLRNGKEAFELATEALKADANSPSYLNALAAAQAELGRYREAAETCDRAIASARLRGEATVAQVFEQRLAVLKAGQPLRL